MGIEWKYIIGGIVVTYSQFDSNIRVLYVFFGLFKKYLKILDTQANFQAFVFYNFFKKKTWKYFFLSTFEKYSYFVCHYYDRGVAGGTLITCM